MSNTGEKNLRDRQDDESQIWLSDLSKWGFTPTAMRTIRKHVQTGSAKPTDTKMTTPSGQVDVVRSPLWDVSLGTAKDCARMVIELFTERPENVLRDEVTLRVDTSDGVREIYAFVDKLDDYEGDDWVSAS